MATANGITVLDARIVLPRIGAWTAELSADSRTPSDLPVRARVTIDTPGQTFRGTVTRSGLARGRLVVRVVGGAGGMGRVLEPRFYRGVFMSEPLRDIMRDAGEELAPDQWPFSFAFIDSWVRHRCSAAEALASLFSSVEERARVALAEIESAVPEAVAAINDFPPAVRDFVMGRGSFVWRVLADGALWVSGEEWWEQPFSLAYRLLREWPDEGRIELLCEQLTLRPGVLIEGRRVSRVEHVITPDRTRTMVWTEA